MGVSGASGWARWSSEKVRAVAACKTCGILLASRPRPPRSCLQTLSLQAAPHALTAAELRSPATAGLRPPVGGRCTINIATATQSLAADAHPEALIGLRNVHVFGARQVDRSPGGTGTTAHVAIRSARGELPVGERLLVESAITGGRFVGRNVGETQLGGHPAVVTEVTGSAHITGFHQFVVDPDDRLAEGFLIEDA